MMGRKSRPDMWGGSAASTPPPPTPPQIVTVSAEVEICTRAWPAGRPGGSRTNASTCDWFWRHLYLQEDATGGGVGTRGILHCQRHGRPHAGRQQQCRHQHKRSRLKGSMDAGRIEPTPPPPSSPPPAQPPPPLDSLARSYCYSSIRVAVCAARAAPCALHAQAGRDSQRRPGPVLGAHQAQLQASGTAQWSDHCMAACRSSRACYLQWLVMRPQRPYASIGMCCSDRLGPTGSSMQAAG